MKDDAKKFLKEKLGAVANDDELDNVAGGTTEQSIAILNGIMKFDEAGVTEVFNKVGEAKEHQKEILIATGARNLLQKHFGIMACPIDNRNNVYVNNGQSISHDDVMQMIKAKADA